MISQINRSELIDVLVNLFDYEPYTFDRMSTSEILDSLTPTELDAVEEWLEADDDYDPDELD